MKKIFILIISIFFIYSCAVNPAYADKNKRYVIISTYCNKNQEIFVDNEKVIFCNNFYKSYFVNNNLFVIENDEENHYYFLKDSVVILHNKNDFCIF